LHLEIVMSDPNVAVSLLLPSGLEVTSANASLGYTFTMISGGGDDPDDVPVGFLLTNKTLR
jgi:hypothetical protein